MGKSCDISAAMKIVLLAGKRTTRPGRGAIAGAQGGCYLIFAITVLSGDDLRGQRREPEIRPERLPLVMA